MAKQFLVSFLLFLVSLPALPKSLFHDCREINTANHEGNDDCQVCHFVFSHFISPEIALSQWFELAPLINNFSPPLLLSVQLSIDLTNKGPPSLA
jgi:hypothetical protein